MNYTIIPGLKRGQITKRIIVMEMSRTHTSDAILNAVAKYFKVSESDLKGRSRRREWVYPRQIAMWIMHRTTSMSLKDIGGFFGRDHTTAIHSRDTINDLMCIDPIIKEEVESLLANL